MRPCRPDVELLEAAFDTHVYDRHMHDALAVGVTLRGVQRFWCRGSTYDSRPGDVIVLDPGDVHDGRSGSHGGYAHRMLYVDRESVRSIVADAFGPARPSFTSDTPLLHDRRLAREIDAAWSSLAVSPVSLQSDQRLHRIVRSLASRMTRAGIARQSVNLPALARVRDYLHDHVDRQITVGELAAIAESSRFQLTRQFQRVFALPLHAYHLHVRLGEAKRRLRQGQSIASTAADLGFTDQSHFHRRFRGAFGITPAEWRRTPIQDR
jgi:AraC-like DNA-binding protein